ANGAVLSVGTGEGISVTADKVGLHFNATIGNNSNKNGGLGADTEGLYVRLGVASTRRGLYAYAGTNNEATLGVYADESHFKFASGNGILQLKSSVMLQPGMISMFAGTAIPDGWELCDGKNKTPDLSARFIASARAEEPDVVYIIKASTEA
ncbi:TPA: tail fiber protein, partial [Pseudomonas aeruginosa]|nr:tail fiber protein [Pseudomonas aeruginosa]